MLILFILTTFFALTACEGSDTYDAALQAVEVFANEAPKKEKDFSLPELAADFFARLQLIWDNDDGAMWGAPLHSAVIIFCTDTGITIANRPDAEGGLKRLDIDGIAVYKGERRVRRNIISHGFWNDERAVFLCLSNMLNSPYQEIGEIIYTHNVNIGLVNHYIIHWKQHNGMLPLGLGQSPGGSYSIENNINYMMEINALIKAILAHDETERMMHSRNALSLRHFRRTNSRILDLGRRENEQIIHEGLPTFTEMVLPLANDEVMYSINLWPEFILWRGSDISLSYGYFGGALYGILLDALKISWRPYVGTDTDLGNLLIEYFKIDSFVPMDEIHLEQYGYNEIVKRLSE